MENTEHNEKFKQAFAYHQEGKLTPARDLYIDILEQEPQNSQVWDLLGVLYMQANKFDEGEYCIKKAIEIMPQIYYLENLGQLYLKKEDFVNAIAIYKSLIELKENEYEYWFNLAVAYKGDRQWDNSKNAYLKSIEINPNAYESYYNLSYLYFNEGKPEKAVECLKKTVELKPDDWESEYFLSLAYMQTKNYKDGLKCFESRLCRSSAILSQEKTYPNLIKEKPIWTGKEDLSDKVLYTYYEAGFGDVWMLYRFMPELTSKCKKVIFKPQKQLAPLFKENSYGAEIMDIFDFEENMYFDYHLPFLSLPYVLGKSGDDMFVSHDKPYLKSNPEKVKEYKEKYFNNDKFKVGIKWQGNAYYDKERILKVTDFFPLFEVPNTKFYSCQTYEGSEEFDNIKEEYEVENIAATFKDFSDTAAVIENLDLVICNDTSLAHLAGAMQKPCWVLLPHVYNWRWHKDLSKCDWYDSVKLFAQPENGDWDSVFKEVLKEFKTLF